LVKEGGGKQVGPAVLRGNGNKGGKCGGPVLTRKKKVRSRAGIFTGKEKG